MKALSTARRMRGSQPRRGLLDAVHSMRPAWAAPVLGAAGAALAVAVLQLAWPVSTVATATIALEPPAGAATGSGWVGAQKELIRSERVAQLVLQQLGADGLVTSAGELLANLDVEPAGDGAMLNVSYRSGNAAVAARVANAFVAAYDRLGRELKAKAAAALAQAARERLGRLREAADLSEARVHSISGAARASDFAALPDASRLSGIMSQVSWSGLGETPPATGGRDAFAAQAEPAAAVSGAAGFAADAVADAAAVRVEPGLLQAAREEFDLARRALAAAESRYADLAGERIAARSPLVVVEAAAPGADRAAPFHFTWVWAAALLGLMAGLALRPLAQRIDPRVRDSSDVAARLGVPVFGALVNAERRAAQAGVRRRRRARPAPLHAAVVLP